MHDLSIIIVNWNGKKWLEKCISSILSQSYSNFEIIFVDNASTDGSIEYLNEHFPDPRIKIVKSPTNLGFAGGNNLGITYSS
jgi:GT2 family glycosyltransferase